MSTGRVIFDGDDMKNMAIFIAQLVREGVLFEAGEQDGGVYYVVKLTGGF